jgi:hypothetical protein
MWDIRNYFNGLFSPKVQPLRLSLSKPRFKLTRNPLRCALTLATERDY